MSNNKQYDYALPVGYVLRGGENDYVIEEVLGKGGFGITYKVKARIKAGNITVTTNFAVKEYFPNSCWRDSNNSIMLTSPTMQDEVSYGLADFINEGNRLQRICGLNPSIVNVNEVFQSNGTAYYVLEYLEGGNLRKLLENNGGIPLTEAQMLGVMQPVASAIECLHNNQMLHLDIKPDNIVMRQNYHSGINEPVLIDFGIATHFDINGIPTSKTPSLGISPGYSPIEQYSQVRHFDPRIDIYAFSATCLYLLTGHDPIEAMNMHAGYVRSVLPAGVSNHVANAIERGMSLSKDYRPQSINELMSLLGGYVTQASEHMPLYQGADNNMTLQGRGNIGSPISAAAQLNNGRTKKKVASRRKKSTNKMPVILTVAALAVVGALVGVMLSNKGDNKSNSNNGNELVSNQSDIEEREREEQARQDSIAAVQERENALAAEQARQDSIASVHENIKQLYKSRINEFKRTEEGKDGEYSLFDITGDGVPELWTESNLGAGNMYVYTYSDGSLKKIYTGNGGHAQYYTGKGYAKVAVSYMGYGELSKLTYRNGRIVEQTLYKEESMDAVVPDVSEPEMRSYPLTNLRPVESMF